MLFYAVQYRILVQYRISLNKSPGPIHQDSKIYPVSNLGWLQSPALKPTAIIQDPASRYILVI